MGFSLRKGLQKDYEKEELRRKAKERESYKELVQNLLEKHKGNKESKGKDPDQD
jgi:hypothetical protein